MKFFQYTHRSLTPYSGYSLSTIYFSQGKFRISKQDRQTQGIRLQDAFPIPQSGSHLKLYMEELPISLPLFRPTTFFYILVMSAPSIYWREYILFSIFFYSRLLCLLYDLTPCTLILSSNSVWHVTAQIDPFSPIITWASILFYNHQFLESQPLVVCFHNPLDFCPFTLVGFRVIAPALHPAHIGGLTVSSRRGRMRSVHNKIIFL